MAVCLVKPYVTCEVIKIIMGTGCICRPDAGKCPQPLSCYPRELLFPTIGSSADMRSSSCRLSLCFSALLPSSGEIKNTKNLTIAEMEGKSGVERVPFELPVRAFIDFTTHSDKSGLNLLLLFKRLSYY